MKGENETLSLSPSPLLSLSLSLPLSARSYLAHISRMCVYVHLLHVFIAPGADLESVGGHAVRVFPVKQVATCQRRAGTAITQLGISWM